MAANIAPQPRALAVCRARRAFLFVFIFENPQTEAAETRTVTNTLPRAFGSWVQTMRASLLPAGD